MRKTRDILPVVSGVYLLFTKHRLTYVGSSTDCYRRISDHRTNGRRFDNAFVVPCQSTDAKWIEKALISQLAPEENIQHKPVEGKPKAPAEQARSSADKRAELVSRMAARKYATDMGLGPEFSDADKSGALPFKPFGAPRNGRFGVHQPRVITFGILEDWCRDRRAEKLAQLGFSSAGDILEA
jgi:predicted GIY-YIG superfamily endonuclease